MSNEILEDEDQFAVEGDGVDDKEAFEAEMLARVKREYKDGKDFLRPFHQRCVEMTTMYHNARAYDKYAADNKFPVSFFQEQIDLAVAETQDRLWFKNQPCKLVPRPTANAQDVEQKQEVMDYQDRQDKVQRKFRSMLRDAYLNRMAIAQVDYDEKFTYEYQTQQQPIVMEDVGGQPIIMQAPDGSMAMQSVSEKVRTLSYAGSRVKRVDPINLFFTQDKRDADDDEALMVRSMLSRKDLRTKAYYIKKNVDLLPDVVPGEIDSEEADLARTKREMFGTAPDKSRSRKPYEYVEWQGKVSKHKLYKYEGREQELEGIDPNEECWCICGMVIGATVVRLHESPFDFDRPNIIIGVILDEEEETFGGSIADKIIAAQKGMEKMAGVLLANLKGAVNAGHVLNVNNIENDGKIDVNEEGFVIRITGGDVRAVHKRIEQPKVAADIYTFLDILKFWGQSGSGINDLKSGRGDKASETLGESQIVTQFGALRTTEYLQSIESTFVVPLWEMRNQINMQFIPTEYLYLIIGPEGVERWQTISRVQIMAGVTFRCEGASRETNRSVLTQQILQLSKIVPLMSQTGVPVRMDKLVQRLCTSGFSWSQEEVEDFLPLLRMEREQGQEAMDQMMVENALLQQAAMRAQLMTMLGQMQLGMAGGGAAPPPGGQPGGAPSQPQPSQPQPSKARPSDQVPNPSNDQASTVANQARNQTPTF